MLTFLCFEAFLISQWHQVSLKYLWFKFTSCLQPILSRRCGILQKYSKNKKDSHRKLKIGIMSIEEKFQAAVRVIHSLPKDGPYQPSNSTKLKFYGMFKQATDGPCNIPKPAFYDLIGRYKWDAWNKLGDMGKEAAMIEYVEGLKEIVETMSFNGDVQDFLDSIGPFYEFVNLQGPKMNHVKEKIDLLTSSSSSSGSSSVAVNSLETSPINSCPNSPLKNPQGPLTNGDIYNENGEDEEESSKLQVNEDTNTYETVATKATVHQNGNSHASLSQNGWSQNGEDADGDFDSNFVIPPPTPMHTYGFIKRNSYSHNKRQTNDEDDIGEETEANEIFQDNSTGVAICKEDLEKDPGYETGPTRVSNDTLTTTSGTESEKYYSGDSEPETEERFLSYYSHQSTSENCNPGSSKSIDLTDHAHINNTNENVFTRAQLLQSSSSIDNKAKITSNGGSSLVRRNREKPSPPRTNGGLNHFSTLLPNNGVQPLTGDLVVQSAVERLNRDVEHILARLRILETAYATSAEGTSSRSPQRRRLFGDLSKASMALIVMWPFAVHFIIRLISWWRKRRMARRLTN